MTGDELKYGQVPTDIEGVDALIELALDLRSEWHHGSDFLWRHLDADLWEATRNPWVVLQTVSRQRLETVLGEAQFHSDLQEFVAARRASAQAPAWFQEQHADAGLNGVAYFSMEFMLSEALPIYSGGLGNVAGDQLKAANDLGVPVIGVGLLYQQGYFRQLIDPAGGQQAVYPYNDPGQLPVTPLRDANGEWLRVRLAMPGHAIWVRAWQARVGRLELYLLDTNDAANHPPYRGITGELYGGGPDLRLMQEMVLGIGGWQLLRALGKTPDVCHLNEGHAALAVLERARCFMADSGEPFDVALAATRAGNVFTTHTAVPAGFDRFTPEQMSHCLRGYAETGLGIGFDDLLALGRRDPGDPGEDFNMAYLAIRGSAAVNGVSRLHGSVSRRLFAPLFPRWPEQEIPIGHVTNGVHTPTWDSAPADALWSDACGQDRWRGETETLERDICCVSDAELWQLRSDASVDFVAYVRRRLSRQLAESGVPAAAVEAAQRILDPKTMTLGFARRFATYKRPDLLLRDPQRLVSLLDHAERPLQIVLAGKAHPADLAGQALIRQWVAFSRRPEVAGRVVFLSDYDMHLAEQLVQGVDVWLNTPRRPWEASGTSGMKVLVNGGINLSVLDGWWAEAYTPEVGWALGDGREHGDDDAWDAAEADALYELLENEVVPEFYDRDGDGMPRAWVARMRASMARLTPWFSTNRTVREYVERYYLPAARRYRRRTAKRGELAAGIAYWRRALDQHWQALRIAAPRIDTEDGQHRFEAEVALGGLDPRSIAVEVFADAVDGGDVVRQPMTPIPGSDEASGIRRYRAAVPAVRPATDYTVRIVPHNADAAVPLEAPHIHWQR
ncbi:MAG: alpha-glucan phosphorylase [Gammaproteobacteria bacterium]|nr:alpha-glucan phosphorylase [Gammaproteobacteria bacterium]|tara:strand:+ start:2216 stop:4750 length:2535 start_codon:yes stop_codon:yes gene_type:complete